MTLTKYNRDPNIMVRHFKSRCQKGHGTLPVFRGTRMQYGYGLGSFFGKIFRTAVPMVKDVWKLVKPHAARAAKGVIKELISPNPGVMAPMPSTTSAARGNKRPTTRRRPVRRAKRVKRVTPKDKLGEIF